MMYIDGANLPGAFRLDARSLHNQMSNSNSVKGALFTCFLATQWYKVRSYAIDIHGIHLCYEISMYVGTFRLDTRFLHNQTSDSNSVNGTLFTGFLATQQYRVRPYVMDIHRVA